MPTISETKRIKGHPFLWIKCPDCGLERWVSARMHGKRCRKCAPHYRPSTFGERSPNFKRGWQIDKNGYKCVRIYPDDFFYPMAPKSGYVREHRLVMAKHLGRCLHRWEIVHHKKGVPKDENRIEGLQLVTDDRHIQITLLENEIKNLQRQNKELREAIEIMRPGSKQTITIRSDKAMNAACQAIRNK